MSRRVASSGLLRIAWAFAGALGALEGIGACAPEVTGPPGCDPTTPCPTREHCVYPDQRCGRGRRGQCVPSRIDCDGAPFPPLACSCNGFVAPKACIDVGGDFTDAAECSDGTFPCGDLACRKYVEYCVTTSAGGTSTYACEATPGACAYGVADCSCVDAGAKSCDDTDDLVTVVMPAG